MFTEPEFEMSILPLVLIFELVMLTMRLETETLVLRTKFPMSRGGSSIGVEDSMTQIPFTQRAPAT